MPALTADSYNQRVAALQAALTSQYPGRTWHIATYDEMKQGGGTPSLDPVIVVVTSNGADRRNVTSSKRKDAEIATDIGGAFGA